MDDIEERNFGEKPESRLILFFRQRPGLMAALLLLFLAIIIPVGAWMSRAADGKYVLLCLVSTLDMSISSALLLSSLMFWKMHAFTDTVKSN